MNISKYIFPRSGAWLVLGSAVFLVLGGCARDASLGSKITGHVSTGTAATTGPQIPNSPSIVTINPGTVIDASNEGGVDSVLTHQTASGSLNLSKVSVGGSYQREMAVSAHFKVMGGIYAQ